MRMKTLPKVENLSILKIPQFCWMCCCYGYCNLFWDWWIWWKGLRIFSSVNCLTSGVPVQTTVQLKVYRIISEK